MVMSRLHNLYLLIRGILTISVRFIYVINLGVDSPLEEGYTHAIEVNVLCEQIPTPTRKSPKARVYSRAFFIPILKGDSKWTTD